MILQNTFILFNCSTMRKKESNNKAKQILLMGESTTGKTFIALRLAEGRFNKYSLATVGTIHSYNNRNGL